MSALTGLFADVAAAATAAAGPLVAGRVVDVAGVNIGIAGVDVAVGDLVDIEGRDGSMPAEVVAVTASGATAVAYGDVAGIRSGAPVVPAPARDRVPVGPGLLGRVVDAFGQPVDGNGPVGDVRWRTSAGKAPSPLARTPVRETMALGVRALDCFVPLGRGQRIGIFAGSGVGKSTLLGMCTRGAQADVIVVCLVGERGREVGEFLTEVLGDDGRSRAVVVCATSDEPAPARYRAAWTATRIAEGFRDEGLDVLLLVDSVTRFCSAHRELAAAGGELPVARGYPASTFAMLPRLLERAGTAEVGSITALYTVLVDGDDLTEPVADAVRSILDGHVVLSRRLADAGHFPTVDVLASVSRLANTLLDDGQLATSRRARELLAAHAEARDLIDIGAYQAGANPTVDAAVAVADDLAGFCQQDMHDTVDAGAAWDTLAAIVTSGERGHDGPGVSEPAARTASSVFS